MQKSDNFPSIQDFHLNQELNGVLDYVVWLLDKYTEEQSDSNFLLHIKKDIIVHLGSLVEGFLFYILQTAIEHNRILPPKNTEHKEVKRLYSDMKSKNEYIAIMSKKERRIKVENIDFAKMVDILCKENIFCESLKESIEEIRKYRNGIHISKKMVQDTAFQKIDLLDYTNRGLDIISNDLTKILEEVKKSNNS